MSQRPWTPGPWTAYQLPIRSNQARFVPTPFEETWPNTQLIALAPELAEALLAYQSARDTLDDYKLGTGPFFGAERRLLDLAERLRGIGGAA